MEVKNCIEERIKHLQSTGLCKFTDFDPETKNRFENYTFNFAMSDAAKQLLRLARKELQLLDSQLERIERITMAIMKLEKRIVAETQDIAEAIQYVCN